MQQMNPKDQAWLTRYFHTNIKCSSEINPNKPSPPSTIYYLPSTSISFHLLVLFRFGFFRYGCSGFIYFYFVKGYDHAPMIFRHHLHLAPEDLVAHYFCPSLGRYHHRSQRRKFLLHLLVVVVLIAQATFQPPASTGYLRGVQRRFLKFGHAHGQTSESDAG